MVSVTFLFSSALFLLLLGNFGVIIQIGLKGEALSLYSLSGSSSVEWGEPYRNQPLTWYKVWILNMIQLSSLFLEDDNVKL